MHATNPLAVAALLLALVCLPARAFQQEITLEESLGYYWDEDLVHRTVTFAPAAKARPEAVRLLRDGTPVPVQLENIRTAKDGTLRQADVWFRAGLPANSRQRFMLRDGANTVECIAPVTLRDGKMVLELDNGFTAVRVPAGTWTAPAGASPEETARALAMRLGVMIPTGALPGPLLGVQLPTGEWTAAAILQPQGTFDFPPLPGLMQPVGPKAPAGTFLGYRTEILARGPLTARVRVTYTFAGNGEYATDITLRSGEPLVRLDERYRKAGAVTYMLTGVKPTAAGYQSNSGPATGRSLPINYTAPSSLVGMFVGWNFFFTNISACYSLTGDPRGNVLGLVSTDADWLPFPYNQALMLGTEGDRLTLRGPLGDGQRHWGLYVGKASDPPTASTMTFYRWWFQRVILSLDKIANWQLTWPGMDEIAFPHTFFDRADIPAIQQRLHAEPAIANYMQRLKPRTDTEVAAAYLYASEPALLDQLATNNDPRKYLDDAVRMHLAACGYFTASNYNPMQLTDEILQRQVGLELLLGSNRLTPAERHTALARIAFLVYLMHDPLWLPPNYAYEPDKPIPYPGYVQGTPNQKHCYFSVRAMLAMALANHPEKARWRQYALEENERVSPSSVAESGVHLESPFYSARDTMRYGPFWTAMGRAGVDRADYNKWFAREKMTYEYLADMLTPPEPRMNGRRVYQPLGRSSSGVVDPTFMIGNEPWGKGDPAHAALMRWCWEQQGKPTFDSMGTTGGRDLSLTLLAFSTLPPTSAGATPLHSRRWEGFGAILRSQVNSGFESNVVFRHDAFAWNLYEQNNGAVYFYGKGAPLLPRFGGYWMGQQGQPHLMSVPFGNRLYFADGMKEQDWKNGLGTMTACATLGDQADYAAGVTLDDSWARGVLFAKDLDRDDPVYLLVRDDVKRKDVGSALHWWVLSKDVAPDGFEKPGVIPTKGHDESWLEKMGHNWTKAPTLRGQLQHFAGQCGVDVDLFIAVPAEPKIVTDAIGVGPNESYNVNPKMYEFQQLVRIEQAAGAGSYLTLLTPRWPGTTAPRYRTIADGCGVAVNAEGRDDRLFLAPAATTYTDDLVRFTGRAGYVRTGGAIPLRLMVVDGAITAKGITLISPTPAALWFDGKVLTVHCGKDAKTTVQLDQSLRGMKVKYLRE